MPMTGKHKAVLVEPVQVHKSLDSDPDAPQTPNVRRPPQVRAKGAGGRFIARNPKLKGRR